MFSKVWGKSPMSNESQSFVNWVAGILLFAVILFFPISAQEEDGNISVLVFSKTKGFRHSSIPNSIKCMFELGQEHGWNVTATEDASLFNKKFLGKFDVVIRPII